MKEITGATNAQSHSISERERYREKTKRAETKCKRAQTIESASDAFKLARAAHMA